MTDYRSRLHLAIMQTQAMGLSTDSFELLKAPQEKHVGKYGDELVAAMHEEFGASVAPEYFSSKCLDVTLRMRPHVNEILRTNALITIGGVSAFNAKVIPFADTSLLGMRATGDYHVWLTLPSLEIIDFTLLASLQTLAAVPAKYGQIILGNPSDIREFSWSPCFVGPDVAKRLSPTV